MLYSTEVLTDAPSYYYRLAETSGTTLDNIGSVDSAGDMTANATVDPQSSLISSDTANGSLKFSWNLPCFRASTASSFSQEPMTVEFVVTPVTLNGFGAGDAYVVTCGNSGADGWSISWGHTTGVWKFTSNGVFDYTFSSATNAQVGVKQHMAFVLDSAHDVSLYQNGLLAQKVLHTVAPNATTANLQIGRITGGTAGMEGIIDEIAIYGTELSAARIFTHYVASLDETNQNKRFRGRKLRRGEYPVRLN